MIKKSKINNPSLQKPKFTKTRSTKVGARVKKKTTSPSSPFSSLLSASAQVGMDSSHVVEPMSALTETLVAVKALVGSELEMDGCHVTAHIREKE